MSGFHFPKIGWWCWIALGIWVGDRLWRIVRFGWVNGQILRPSHKTPGYGYEQAWDMGIELRDRQWSPNHGSTYSERFDISMYAEPENALLPDSASFSNQPSPMPGGGVV